LFFPSPPTPLPRGEGRKASRISLFPLSLQERGLGGEVKYSEILEKTLFKQRFTQVKPVICEAKLMNEVK